MTQKKVCFSIGVASPEKLEKLPGAIDATASIAAWAGRPEAGFEVHAITDAAYGEVTVDLLNREFMAVLKRPDVIDHLVVHFAGHGVSNGASDQLLLLTHWFSKPAAAIKLSRFMRLLQRYQVKRVSLFIDACRTLPTLETDEVEGSGILDRPEDDPRPFREDRFLASVHGSAAYMLKDVTNSGPARCIFSTVLVRTLCGCYPEAIDTRGGDRVVTSAQITNALELHVPLEAGRHGLDNTPIANPGFIPPNDVYTRLPIDLIPPELPAPPPRERGPRRTRGGGGGRPSPLESFGKPPDEEHQRTKALLDQFDAEYKQEDRPTHFETSAGCAVVGAAVDYAVVTPPITVGEEEERGQATWWRFEDRSVPDRIDPRGPASLLMRSGDGDAKVWFGAAVVPRKIVTFTVRPGLPDERAGAASVIYRPSGGWVPDSDIALASSRSQGIVARLRAGTLTGNEALDVAVKIRTDKHVDPTLGAIAAYLYDAIGDRDNIRRIAFFYAIAGEPIPFDVALLADIEGTLAEDGRLVVDIPAVAGREPRTIAETEHANYFRETRPVQQCVVAGGFPWLRQGWALLDAVRLPVHPGVIELAQTPRILRPFPFTTLAPDAGLRLAELIATGKV